jgi:hypothetical protein
MRHCTSGRRARRAQGGGSLHGPSLTPPYEALERRRSHPLRLASRAGNRGHAGRGTRRRAPPVPPSAAPQATRRCRRRGSRRLRFTVRAAPAGSRAIPHPSDDPRRTGRREVGRGKTGPSSKARCGPRWARSARPCCGRYARARSTRSLSPWLWRGSPSWALIPTDPSVTAMPARSRPTFPGPRRR